MSEYPEQIKILCVDDERNVLRALERIFLDDDYEIVLAGSGEEGLKVMAESGPFQVVISDYRMPVMNGVEFLKGVYDRWPETVRIVLSGYADASAIVAAINEGHIYRFIPKPWNDDELRITIQNCLERYFLQQKNCELLAQLGATNQVLEDKVQQRTEQLELRNRALEFSQSLLGGLPVGVVGVDINGMIAYCNDIGARLLKDVCGDIFGADVSTCCNASLGLLVAQVRLDKTITVDTVLGSTPCRVIGRTITFSDSEAIVLVFLER
ncbi:MAG: response regulator [Desulfuromonadaceae bacterium]|nr:response regulator [Desulfuromonadaceae bacterium]MDD2848021.1 response regulator [Desulfuromonadaceae bacterium]MDD4131237.1 response regulator [Desulfuromonadaceae bacterium]